MPAVVKKSVKQMEEDLMGRVSARTDTIKTSLQQIEQKKKYQEQLDAMKESALAKYEEKIQNLDRMMETSNEGIAKEQEKIESREENLRRLMEVKDEFDKKKIQLDQAVAEDIEVKADMSKGMSDFIITEDRILKLKKELGIISARAGAVYYGK